MEELTEDEIAQAMEDALTFGKGKPYTTRGTHGAVLANQQYRVWRTKAMSIAVLSFTPFPDGMRTKTQTMVSYEHKNPPYWVLYEYKAYWWYFEGLEQLDAYRLTLETYFKTLKSAPKRKRDFQPY
jgi:hypothetical protein